MSLYGCAMVQNGREEKEKRPPLLLTSVRKENKEKQGHKKKPGLAQEGKPGTFTLGTNTAKKNKNTQNPRKIGGEQISGKRKKIWQKPSSQANQDENNSNHSNTPASVSARRE